MEPEDLLAALLEWSKEDSAAETTQLTTGRTLSEVKFSPDEMRKFCEWVEQLQADHYNMQY